MERPFAIVVDGVQESRALLVREFDRNGYRGLGVTSAGEAMECAEGAHVAVIGCEIQDASKTWLCKQLRGCVDVLVVMACSDVTEQVLAFQAGADHCVLSEVSTVELIARIDAVRRRLDGVNRHPAARSLRQSVVLGDALRTTVRGVEVVVDRATCTLLLGGSSVAMTPKEVELLAVLIEQVGTNVPREELMARVWNDASGVRTRTLDTHISNIRRKIGSRDTLLCVRGIGYRFIPS